MAANRKWYDMEWNPTTGCTKVSAACDHCIARQRAMRLCERGAPYWEAHMFKPFVNDVELYRTFRQNRPLLIAVGTMGDLFHPSIPESVIMDAFRNIESNSLHTFAVCTKRPERARDIAARRQLPENLWLGVSIESGRYAKRAEVLKEIPAALRFVEAAPLYGPLKELDLNGIDWLIVRGEQNRDKETLRIMKPDWVRGLRDRCQAMGIPFFFMGWGSTKLRGRSTTADLDGQVYMQWPTRPKLRSVLRGDRLDRGEF